MRPLSSSLNLSILVVFLLAFSYQQPSGNEVIPQDNQLVSGVIMQLMSTSNCQTNCAVCSPPTFMACQQCAIGYVLQNTGLCVACPVGCDVCIGEQSCSQCRAGYAPTNQIQQSRCIPCSRGCQKCLFLQITSGSTVQLTTCTTCFNGYYLSNQSSSSIQTCQPCMTACYLCQEPQTCFQCVSGFGYNNTINQCYPCSANCIYCTPISGCVSCAFGYRAVASNGLGQCVSCLSNCQKCYNGYTCNTCSKGFYPFNTTNQQSGVNTSKCVPCPNNCLNCHNQKYCLSCGVGYFLDVVFSEYYNQTTNVTSPVVDSSTCQPCPNNCNACTEFGSCSQCQSGYYVDSGGNCMLCGVACHECLASGQCLSCQGSYYLIHGVCKPCVEPCSTCYVSPSTPQAIFCVGCVSLYYTPLNGQCLACSSVSQGCSTCHNQNECLSCSQGYNLHEGKCILNHHLGAVYIVMICIAGIIGMVAVVFGVWAVWRHRNGYGSMDGNSFDPGVRATYYQIP